MPDYTVPKQDNGRVPVLQEQYRQLLENDKEIKALLLAACQRWDTDHDRLIVLEAKVQRNTERIGIWQAGQAIWTTVAATLAGWFGTRP